MAERQTGERNNLVFLDTHAQGEFDRFMLLNEAPPWPGFQSHCLDQNMWAFHQTAYL